jgi:hypothetical protein
MTNLDTAFREEVVADHGEKMIEVRVRFFTDKIANEDGKVVPGHCHSVGIARLTPNEPHGLKGSERLPFNSMAELPLVIEQVLIDNGITVHPGPRERNYRA